jgi:hypothetical protein
MFLDEFVKYSSQYRNGIKSISFRSGVPKIEKISYALELKEFHGNYELFFNSKGVLTHSVHHDKPYKCTMVFGYGYGKRLIATSKLHTEDQSLLELTQYYYDKSNRIRKEVNWNFYGSFRWNDNDKAIHTYKEDSKIIVLPKSRSSDVEATFITRYDEHGKITEEKSFSEPSDLISWSRNEYNSAGELMREISLDENGMEDGVYEYLPFKDGLATGYRYKSIKESYLKEYRYTYDEKGNWNSQVVLLDGEPQYIHERAIIYQ